MSSIQVNLKQGSYPVYVGIDLIDQGDLIAEHITGPSVGIVTNTTVASYYAERLQTALRTAGKNIITIILPDGEIFKNWETLNLIFNSLLTNHADRSTTLIALGGGVIGDITGFAASTYMRGIPFLQVPTTLLAQVDSSIGGKTAINHPLGKNMIGTFHQPKAVFSDIAILKSLSSRQLSAGLAEVIKIATISDKDFFEWVEKVLPSIMNGSVTTLSEVVCRSCSAKARIVAADERENNIRAILNFGHTFGHAIELGLGYGKWLHGEAIACGMLMASDLSVRLGLLTQFDADRLRSVIEAANLPIHPPRFGEDRYFELMYNDKKRKNSAVRFVLIKSFGKWVITNVPEDKLRATLKNN